VTTLRRAIQVDASRLRDLASGVHLVRRDLANGDEGFRDTDGLRSPRIEKALVDFNAHWSQRRRSLLEALEDAEETLRRAARRFVEADSSLAAAGSDSAAPPPEANR
jgi:hypothetical protein